MKSGAEELFDQIISAGWAGVERWKSESQAETYLLEFKGLGHENPKLGKFDKENIGKAASGFANASGGVLVVGVRTTKLDGADIVDEIKPTLSLRAYHAAIEAHLAQCSDPRVPGARAHAIPTAGAQDQGIIAILFPPSDGGPHRAKSAGDHSDKYFHRQGTQTLVLEHPLLAAVFGRTPPPRLVLRVAPTQTSTTFGIWVRNVGRGAAREVFLRIGVFGGDPDLRLPHKRGPLPADDDYFAEGWRALATRRDERDYGIRSLVLSPPPLYSGDESLAARFRYDGFNYFRVIARIDAEGMQPVSVSECWTPYEGAQLGDDGRRDINLFPEDV